MSVEMKDEGLLASHGDITILDIKNLFKRIQMNLEPMRASMADARATACDLVAAESAPESE